jgi:hypothetical protein
MLILYFVGTIALSTLVAAAPLLLLPWLPDDSHSIVVLATVASMLIVCGAVIPGALVPWLPRKTDDRVRALRRIVLTTGSTQAVGLATYIVCAAVVGAPAWVPLVVAGAAALLTAFSYGAGNALGRRPLMTDAAIEALGEGAHGVRRTLRLMTVVGASVAAATAALALALQSFLGRMDGRSVAAALLIAVTMGNLVAYCTSFPRYLNIVFALRAVTDGDSVRARRFARLIVRNKDQVLEPGEERQAVRWAMGMRLFLPLQGIQSAALLLGIGATQMLATFSGDGFTRSVAFWALAIMVLVAALIVPLTIRRYRRVDEYVRRNEHLLAAG